MDIVKIVHLVPALVAFFIGLFLVISRKGTFIHRRAGRIWSFSMLFTAISSFAITGGRFDVFHGYSYIHLLSILTIFMVPTAMWAAKRRFIILHQLMMASLFVALCITGMLAFTMQGRLLNTLVSVQ